jgi:drug/metabolite transporter (DMT)-like permease
VEPLVLTILSVIVLRETIGWRRILAVIAGLIGALVVIRPNWAEYGPTALMPLSAAFFFACYMLTTKVLATGRNKLALQLWTGTSALIFLCVVNIVGHFSQIESATLKLPDQRELLLYLGMGALAVISHQMIVHALARADASMAAPLQYLEIVSATVFGWLVFSDFPDPLTWLGAAIIIASGLYVFHRERQTGRSTT